MADILSFDKRPCDTEPLEEWPVEEVIHQPEERAHRNPTLRERMCDEVKTLICTDRHIQHGDARTNLTNIGIMLDAFDRIVNPECSMAVRAALRLCLVKIARTQSGTFNLDDYLDLGGYAILAGEIAHNEHVVS